MNLRAWLIVSPAVDIVVIVVAASLHMDRVSLIIWRVAAQDIGVVAAGTWLFLW